LLDTAARLERFLAHVDLTGEHQRWTGSVDPRTGTGQFRLDGKLRSAQRAAWELQVGPLPAGVRVRRCASDPRCVQLEHLTLEPSNRQIAASADSIDAFAGHLTVSAAFPLYLAALKRQGRSDNTLTTYRSIFRRWIEPALGSRPVDGLGQDATVLIDHMGSVVPDSATVAKSILNGLSGWAFHERL
jgi:hypothetical protein